MMRRREGRLPKVSSRAKGRARLAAQPTQTDVATSAPDARAPGASPAAVLRASGEKARLSGMHGRLSASTDCVRSGRLILRIDARWLEATSTYDSDACSARPFGKTNPSATIVARPGFE